MKLVLLIRNPGDLRRETKRRALDEPTGETDGPCIDAFFRSYVALSSAAAASRVGRDCALAGNCRPSTAKLIAANATVENFMSDMVSPSS